jgi:type 1 glutamine amidotransferase
MKTPVLSFLVFVLFATVGFAQMQFNLLVLAMPDKYHYEYIPIARKSFEQMARHHQFQLTYTSDPQVLEGELKGFDAVVFLNTNCDLLNDAQRQKFQDYVHSGKGVVLVHAANATHRQWDWYERLIGRSFRIHPYVQTGVITIVDPKFPATFHLPARWLWTDEWYEFDAPYGKELHDVLKVDETTYDTKRIWPGQHSNGMGAYHPVAWYQEFEGARVFCTSLGHMAELYSDPMYLDHLYGGIWWAATGKGIATAP